MRYVSTRSQAPELDFEAAVLAGLARDGGLYVPKSWPRMTTAEIAALAGLTYAEAAVRVIRPFVGDTLDEATLRSLAEASYAGFGHPAVAPLRQLDRGHWQLELFHGPTLAFKDFALQFLGRLFDHVLKRRGARVTIVGATSGDTGSAAIEACRGRDAIDVFILHPKGRVSEVQRRQMTTVADANVHNIAVDGTFDDCQALVKALFNDLEFRDRLALSAVNSINWARVMAQVVYYLTSAVALGAPERQVAFSVPTGNFGDVFAGYVAAQMGLPIARLMVATNRNDILVRALTGGSYEVREVMPTISPSMDIQVSSNFERLLFDLADRDGAEVTAMMGRLRDTGRFDIAAGRLQAAAGLFTAARIDEDETKATMARVWRESGILIDPHTAVAYAAARGMDLDSAIPVVTLSTAHPAKFPDAVAEATGQHPALPARLADLFKRDERCDALPADAEILKDFVAARARILENA
ncbi:threonine synthase [Oceanibacterium hippocampi]|uniref:Threonine synthase n=1 Tax=Oceanibacterium hippocampi TaxID=745714 RepID=A0A1Y5S7I7_9PROT|nr:threonine synthase [Oceanibacterium hippocampi]SLN33314.1 Threonine synthase [Oceanibacterium hippocampi]